MKRGQLSYEYVIITGLLLTLTIPFFYYFFQGVSSQFNVYFATVATVEIAEATQTVSYLHKGSRQEVQIMISGVTKNDIRGNKINLQFANGNEVEAIGGDRLRTSPSAFITGGPTNRMSGMRNARIVNGICGIGLTDGPPVIMYAGSYTEGEVLSPSEAECDSSELTISPDDKLILIGIGFDSSSVVKATKEEKKGGDSDASPSPSNVDVIQDDATYNADVVIINNVFGNGDYTIEVVGDDGTSNTINLNVGAGGGPPPSD